MKSYRLNRLFNAKSNRCFDVAVDHGFFNQPGFLTGIEDMRKVVKTLVDAGPDAIQLTVGQARHLQDIPGRHKPSLVLRTDVANIYGKELPDTAFSLVIEETMLQAVRYDAACICVNLFQIPDAPEVHAQCVQNILKLKPQADHYGMPMMIEPLVFQENAKDGGYMVNGNLTDANTYAKTNGLAKLVADGDLWLEQVKAIGVTLVLSIVATVVIAYIVKAIVGLRPSAEVERQGLDINEHGEEGYAG